MAIYNIKVTILLLLIMGVLKIVISLRVVPERGEVMYLNHKYIKYGRFYIKRYNRGGLYYGNIEGEIYHTWANNISVHLVFNEYLHNEYRRTFVDIRYRLCDLINKDPYFGHLVRIYNIPCPVPANDYHIMNVTVPQNTFPNVWPFKKARVDIEVAHTDTKERILTTYFYASFVNDIESNKTTDKIKNKM